MSAIKNYYLIVLNIIAIIIYNIFFNKLVLQSYKYIAQRIASITLQKSFGESGSISAKFPLFISGLQNAKVGEGFRAEKNLRIEIFTFHRNQLFNPTVKIGKNVSVNENFHLGCINSIEIGDNVLIASNVYISDHAHGGCHKADLFFSPSDRPLITKGSVKIGNNVWIGEGVSILPGVTIGENSIIGANSVVTKCIPKNVVAAGVPAKVLSVIE